MSDVNEDIALLCLHVLPAGDSHVRVFVELGGKVARHLPAAVVVAVVLGDVVHVGSFMTSRKPPLNSMAQLKGLLPVWTGHTQDGGFTEHHQQATRGSNMAAVY